MHFLRQSLLQKHASRCRETSLELQSLQRNQGDTEGLRPLTFCIGPPFRQRDGLKRVTVTLCRQMARYSHD